MPTYGAIAYTDAVRRAQRRLESPVAGSRESAEEPFELGPPERAFIGARDGFYQATVSETGWPYVQFRGGPPGFVEILGPSTIGYADLRGNRQYISAGNLDGDDRVALFFMDYAEQRRLKLYGHADLVEDPSDPRLGRLAALADRGRVERAVIIDVVAAAWNCPQHITPRWTVAEMEAMG